MFIYFPIKILHVSRRCFPYVLSIRIWSTKIGWLMHGCVRIYPLVNKHNYGKSQFLMGKSTMNGNFQKKMYVYQRVHQTWFGYLHGKHVVQKSDMFYQVMLGTPYLCCHCQISRQQCVCVCAISMVFKHKKWCYNGMNISTHSSTTT